MVVVDGGYGTLGRVNEGKKEKNIMDEMAFKLGLDKWAE